MSVKINDDVISPERHAERAERKLKTDLPRENARTHRKRPSFFALQYPHSRMAEKIFTRRHEEHEV